METGGFALIHSSCPLDWEDGDGWSCSDTLLLPSRLGRYPDLDHAHLMEHMRWFELEGEVSIQT